MAIGEIYIYFTKKSISSALQVNMVISFANKLKNTPTSCFGVGQIFVRHENSQISPFTQNNLSGNVNQINST